MEQGIFQSPKYILQFIFHKMLAFSLSRLEGPISLISEQWVLKFTVLFFSPAATSCMVACWQYQHNPKLDHLKG